MKTVKAEFAPGDEVMIQGETEAIVRQISYDGHEFQYNVSYWHDGARKSIWVQPDEIEGTGSGLKIGFTKGA